MEKLQSNHSCNIIIIISDCFVCMDSTECYVKCWEDCCYRRHKCCYTSAIWLTDKIINTTYREASPSWRKWWDSWRGRGRRDPEKETREVNPHSGQDHHWPCQLLQVHLIFKVKPIKCELRDNFYLQALSHPPYRCPRLPWDCYSLPGASVKRTRVWLIQTAPSCT